MCHCHCRCLACYTYFLLNNCCLGRSLELLSGTPFVLGSRTCIAFLVSEKKSSVSSQCSQTPLSALRRIRCPCTAQATPAPNVWMFLDRERARRRARKHSTRSMRRDIWVLAVRSSPVSCRRSLAKEFLCALDVDLLVVHDHPSCTASWWLWPWKMQSHGGDRICARYRSIRKYREAVSRKFKILYSSGDVETEEVTARVRSTSEDMSRRQLRRIRFPSTAQATPTPNRFLGRKIEEVSIVELGVARSTATGSNIPVLQRRRRHRLATAEARA